MPEDGAVKSTFTFAFDCRVSRLIEVRLRREREREREREGGREVKIEQRMENRRGRGEMGRRERHTCWTWGLPQPPTSLPPVSVGNKGRLNNHTDSVVRHM